MTKAMLLGTAQDGGLPQAGCDCANCRRAWNDSSQRRWVTCLGLVDHSSHQSWLIDATPHFPEQLHTLQAHAPDCPLAGILLTHAHVGHYAGLIHLGREMMAAQAMPLYVTPALAGFLRQNAPWSQLVALGHVTLRLLAPQIDTPLSPHLSATPIAVPHRDEYADTVAFVIRGPQKRLLYCPDIDDWDRWEHDLRSLVESMDVALLDATFFSAEELPGRDMRQVPHPLATDTARRLLGVNCDVRLIHLNHTNPLHAPGPERTWLAAQGLRVGATNDRWRLG